MSEENKSEAVKKMFPRMFVKKDETITVEFEIMFFKETGEILSVIPKDIPNQIADTMRSYFGVDSYKFTFSKPSYNQMNRYRNGSSEIERSSRTSMVNNLKLRDYFLIFHLKEWNMTDEEGNVIKLGFEPNGALDDASEKIVYGLHPTILDVVLASFERQMVLV